MMQATFRNDFKSRGECIARKMKNAMRKAARKVAQYARENAPVDTGELRDSIVAEGQTATVGASYGPFVEFGTRKRPARPFFWPAVERVRAEMYDDMKKAFDDCKNDRDDDPDGEPDEGGGSGLISGGASAIGRGGSALAGMASEVAAEAPELAEALPLLLL